MATAYGGESTKSYSWGTGKTRAWVEVTVSNKSDTVCTVKVRGQIQSVSPYYMRYYGARVHAGVYNSGSSGSYKSASMGTWLYDAEWSPGTPVSYSRDFDRKASAYSVTGFCWYLGETVSGYGPMSNSGEVKLSVTIPAMPVYAPNAPTGAWSSRASDYRNDVGWANHADATHPYSSVRLERSVDGGGWSEIAALSGSATSYADASCAPNHYYAYRVRAYNAKGYSGYSTTGYTYNTPAAPSSVTASRKAETTVALTIANPAVTATSLELQRSTNAANWSTVQTPGGTVRSLDDSPGGGTFYYRARNLRGSLVSAWSPTSNAVVTIVAPAAPTLLEPASGIVVSKELQSVRFAWRHNPIDGSGQSAAQVQTSADGGSAWTTHQMTGAEQSLSVANSWPVNSDVLWRVRTKGAHADYGAWSASRPLAVRQVPSVYVTEPASDGTVLTDVPVRVAWSYSDPSGTQQQATVTVSDASGAVLFTRTVQGDAAEISIGTADILLPNSATYAIAVSAVSTSSLSASASRTFATDYAEPAVPEIEIEVDPVLGAVAVSCYEGRTEDGSDVPATTALGIFRRNPSGSLACVADQVPSGTGAVDAYPPLDADLAYVAVAYTSNGLTSQAETGARVPSGGYVVVNYGADRGYRDVAKLAMDAAWGTETEADSEVIETEGDPDPLVFYGTTKRVESEISGTVWWRAQDARGEGQEPATSDAWARLADDAGVKVVRYPYGPVVPSNVVCKISTDAANPIASTVELSARRVRCDGLVL